jgi:hypothetical protein
MTDLPRGDGGKNHNVPGNGVDEFAVVGSIAYKSNQDPICVAAMDDPGPANNETNPGTYVFWATVQHVHAAEGGQAIVGNVNASPEGVGAREKTGGQPHAQLAYAPGVAMPRQVEAERAAVPRAGGAGV